MEQMSKDQFRQHVMNNRGMSPGVLLKQLRDQGVAVEGDVNNPAMKAPGVFEQNAKTFQDRRTGNFVNDVSAAAGMIGKDLSHVASSVFQPIDKAIGKAANFVGTGGGILGRMDDDPSGPFQTLTEGLDLVHRGTDALGNSMADSVRGTPIHSAVKSLGASLDSFDAAHPNAKNMLQDASDFAFGVTDLAFLAKGVEELPGQIGKLKPKPRSASPAAAVVNIPGTSTPVGESSVAGRIKGSLTAQVTGLDSNSQAAINDTATRGMISDMLTGKKAPDTAVERMGRTLEHISNDVSDTGHEYDFVRNSKAMEPVDPPKFQKILQQYGLRFRPEGTVKPSAILKNPIQKGVIEVDPSGPGASMSPMAIKQLETFMQTVGGIDRVTPEVFKNAKSLLVEAGDFYDPSLPGGGSVKGVAGSMLKVLDGIRDNATTADFQAYKELDARYAPKIRALNEIRDLFEPDPAHRGSFRIKDSARGKVLNALKGNKVNLINDLERVSPGITREIRAYETYQNIIRENTPGQYGRAMAKGAAVGFATGSFPGAAIGTVVGILASEPRFMFEVLSKVAGMKEFLGIKPKDIIFKAERGIPLGPKETAAVRAAAKEASQTASTPEASPVKMGAETSPTTLPEPVPNVNGPKALPRDGATIQRYKEGLDAAVAKYPENMSPRSIEDLAQSDVFVSKDGTVGVGLKDGEIFGLYNNSGTKGRGSQALVQAVENGGTRLDALEGGLRDFYEKHGFEVVRREGNWTPGKPDVIFMELNPKKYGAFKDNNVEFVRTATAEGVFDRNIGRRAGGSGSADAALLGKGNQGQPGGGGASDPRVLARSLQDEFGAKNLTQKARSFESKAWDDVAADKNGLISQYEKQFGNVVNTDNARELFSDYKADRSRSAAIHEPASYLTKEIYTKLLKDNVKKGNGRVLFTAGGTGAGKTSGLELFGRPTNWSVVYDTNMNTLKSSIHRIEQALAEGYKVDILHTYREPIDALSGGAIPRAMRMEKRLGSGRPVPLAEHAKTHIGSLDTMDALAKHYADNPNVNIYAADNSLGKGNIELIPEAIDFLRGKRQSIGNHGQLLEQLHSALEAEFGKGELSESLYRAFKK